MVAPRGFSRIQRLLLPTLTTALLVSGCKTVTREDAPASATSETRTLTFQPPADIRYRFTDVIFLPEDTVSNPSGLAYGGRLEDGSLTFWMVCDGSAISRDGIDPSNVVVQLVLSPDGRDFRDVRPLTLDPAVRPCDLEAIAVDPADGTLLVGDERVPREAECGGTGVGGEARSTVFKIDAEGKLLGGPWQTPIINNGNNGIEAIAARLVDGQTHVLVFEERKRGKIPVVLEYLETPGDPPSLTLLRVFRLGLPINATQTGATFRRSDGRLLLLDRNKGELHEIDLDGCPQKTPILCIRTASFEALLEQELGLSGVKREANRYGLAEGLAEDEDGNLYMVLDNNSQPYSYGDRTPRMIRLERVDVQ